MSNETKATNTQEKISIEDVQNTWKTLEDEQLNEAIANTSDEILSNFLKNLDEEELKQILEKETMLKNDINIYSAETPEKDVSNQTIESTQTYYEYLLNLNQISKFARTTPFDTKYGYFFIQISGDGKTTKRKVSVTLTSTDRSQTQTVKFAEVGVTGYSDNHNFTILTATSKMQLVDGYYTIITLQFSYTKKAHYFTGKEYLDKVDGYRFNFNKYNIENVGTSTVNNTGHNTTDVAEVIDLQMHTANCGIATEEGNFETSNATGHLKLYKYNSALKINPNGGTHDGKNSTYTYGNKTCDTQVEIKAPIREGYIFTGWTLTKGNNCSGASFDSTTNKFKYCGKSISSSDISSDDTCTLTANWAKILPLPETGGKTYSLLYYFLGGIIIIYSCIKLKRNSKIK